jgi:hypothetical protein
VLVTTVSVFATAALSREVRRLVQLVEQLALDESVPASVLAQVRAASVELADAASQCRRRLDQAVGS